MNMITVEERTDRVGVILEHFLRGLDKLTLEMKSYPNVGSSRARTIWSSNG